MKNYNIRKKSRKIQAAILDLFLKLEPKPTVRQINDAFTVLGVEPKTENGYRQDVHHLTELRKIGVLPKNLIANCTRWGNFPQTFTWYSLALRELTRTYRKCHWSDQPQHFEIWIEKDALASVFSPITGEYDVLLYVTRGHGSVTFLHDPADNIKATGKPTFIYRFGDFVPFGGDAAYYLQRRLEEYGTNLTYQRVRVTPQQIETLGLPIRETKLSDPRIENWRGGRSDEPDIFSPSFHRNLVSHHTLLLITNEVIDKVLQIQNFEQQQFERNLNNFDLDPIWLDL